MVHATEGQSEADAMSAEEKRRDQLLAAPDAVESDADPRIDVTHRDSVTRIDVRDDAAVRPGGTGEEADGASGDTRADATTEHERGEQAEEDATEESPTLVLSERNGEERVAHIDFREDDAVPPGGGVAAEPADASPSPRDAGADAEPSATPAENPE